MYQILTIFSHTIFKKIINSHFYYSTLIFAINIRMPLVDSLSLVEVCGVKSNIFVNNTLSFISSRDQLNLYQRTKKKIHKILKLLFDNLKSTLEQCGSQNERENYRLVSIIIRTSHFRYNLALEKDCLRRTQSTF